MNASSPGYFVDQARGNDLNDGSYALPFKTLAHLASVLGTTPLPAGHGIYLRCDDAAGQPNVWRESLNLTAARLAGAAKIAGYGACSNVVKATLSGGTDLRGSWVQQDLVTDLDDASKTCRRWSKDLTGVMSAKVTRLVITGLTDRPYPTQPYTLRLAQWPNYKALEFNAAGALSSVSRQYALADSGSGGNTLDAGSAFGSLSSTLRGDTAGATVQLRSSAYYIEPRQVISVSGNNLTLSATPRDANYLNAGDGYLLQNKRWMLDSNGEFFHEQGSSVNTLHVCVGTAEDMNASGLVVEASGARPTLLTVNGRGNVQIIDVAARLATGDGIVLEASPGSTVSAVDMSYNGRAGIRVTQASTGVSVSNSLAQHNWIMGIDSRYATGAHTITGNTVYDTGTEGYAGGSVADVSSGTIAGTYGYIAGIGAGHQATVSNNVIHRTAMIGIRFHGASTISGNDVFQYCQRLSDCGAIYSWVGHGDLDGDGVLDHVTAASRSVSVTGNRLVDGRLNTEGVPGNDSAREIVAGIYLDDLVQNTTASGNLMARSPTGVYVHNGLGHTITANKIWLTTRKGLSVNVDHELASGLTIGGVTHPAVNNVYSNNQIAPLSAVTGTGWNGTKFTGVPKTITSYAFHVTNKFESLGSSGALSSGKQYFSGNQVALLNGEHNEAAYFMYNPTGGTTLERQLTATGWKQLNPAETQAHVIPATFDLIKLELGPNLLPAYSWSTPTTIPWRSAGFSLAQVPYVVRFTGTYNDIIRAKVQLLDAVPGAPSLVIPLDQTNHWSGMSGLSYPTGSNGETLAYEGFVLPTSATSDARFDLVKADNPTGTVALLGAELRALQGYQVAVNSDWVGVAAGNIGSTKTVNCSDFGWPSGCQVKDINGNSVTFPKTLASGENMVFVRVNSSWLRP